MNRLLISAAIIALALSISAVPVLPAPNHQASTDHDQSFPDQSVVAAKTSFARTSTSTAAAAGVIDAKNLAAAAKLVGRTGAFRGTVSKVYSPRDHDIVILDFDPNYQTALTAVVKPASYKNFPPLQSLVGKPVLVTGKFIDYRGKAEIELTNPAQVKVIN